MHTGMKIRERPLSARIREMWGQMRVRVRRGQNAGVSLAIDMSVEVEAHLQDICLSPSARRSPTER